MGCGPSNSKQKACTQNKTATMNSHPPNEKMMSIDLKLQQKQRMHVSNQLVLDAQQQQQQHSQANQVARMGQSTVAECAHFKSAAVMVRSVAPSCALQAKTVQYIDRVKEVNDRFEMMHLNMIVSRISESVRQDLVRKIEQNPDRSAEETELYKALNEPGLQQSKKLLTTNGRIFTMRNICQSSIIKRRINEYQFDVRISDETAAHVVTVLNFKAAARPTEEV